MLPAFDFIPALPEISLLTAACAVLVIDLFVPDSRREISYWLTQLGLLVTAWLSLYPGHERAIQLVAFGYRVDLFHAAPMRTFGNMFVADALADFLTFLTCMSVVLTLAYSRTYLTDRGLFRGETFVLTMFALLGMLVMISANSFRKSAKSLVPSQRTKSMPVTSSVTGCSTCSRVFISRKKNERSCPATNSTVPAES